jgi:hypothetical protein
MIVYLTRNGPPEAMLCPVFLCDHCGEPIQGKEGGSGLGGIVIWRNDYRADHRPGPQEVATVHKGACDRAYEAAHASDDPGDYWSWEEFDVFLRQLTTNTTEPFPVEDNVEYVAPAPSTWRRGHYDRDR